MAINRIVLFCLFLFQGCDLESVMSGITSSCWNIELQQGGANPNFNSVDLDAICKE